MMEAKIGERHKTTKEGLLANSREEVASWVLPGRFQRDYSPACILILGFQILDLCNNKYTSVVLSLVGGTVVLKGKQ